MSPNLMRSPKELLRVTVPLIIRPLTQIFPLATHSPISSLTPLPSMVAVSTKQPPRLVLERLPQTGVAEPSMRSSTATKHFMRGNCLRSSPQDGVKISGSNGGLEAGSVATTCSIGLGWDASDEPAAGCAVADSPLILRMASSYARSRFSGG